MYKVKTESGATYLVDDDHMVAVRLLNSPESPGIDYKLFADGEWKPFDWRAPIEVGKAMWLRHSESNWFRYTTPVLDVEVVE